MPRPSLGDRRPRRSPRPERGPRRASAQAPGELNLTGLVARGLILFLVVVLGWKLISFGFATIEEAQFQRSDITALMPPGRPHPYIDPKLESLLHAQTRSAGTMAVSIRNITTGAQAELNGQTVLPSASLFKLPVLVEVIKQWRERRFSMDDRIVIRNEYWTDGSGVLQARLGERFAVRELLRLMIAESDNIAAVALMDLVGIDNINRTMQTIGLEWTKVQDRHVTQLPHVTTARDMGMLLEVIAAGQLVDRETSEEAIRLLELRQNQNWLDDRLPWYARVAHKWGELPGVRHDAGIVFTPHSTFVVVVMSQGADPSSSAAIISGVAHEALEYFEH